MYRPIQRPERGFVTGGGGADSFREVSVPVHGHTLPSSRANGHGRKARVPYQRHLLGAASAEIITPAVADWLNNPENTANLRLVLRS